MLTFTFTNVFNVVKIRNSDVCHFVKDCVVDFGCDTHILKNQTESIDRIHQIHALLVTVKCRYDFGSIYFYINTYELHKWFTDSHGNRVQCRCRVGSWFTKKINGQWSKEKKNIDSIWASVAVAAGKLNVHCSRFYLFGSNWYILYNNALPLFHARLMRRTGIISLDFIFLCMLPSTDSYILYCLHAYA